MSTLFIIWSGLLIAVTLVWLSRHYEINRAKREQEKLASSSFDGPPNPAPKVSILVAAKDEEENIETCVTTLFSQDYPNFEVIAINDRSTDRTPEILDRMASDNRHPLKALHVKELREGWFGKNNAMREGMQHAAGQWLCFTDADCRQVSDKTISVAMRYALENQIDFLSVLPVLETKNFWERVIQPACAGIMALWFTPRKVNDPQSSASYANGAFMLMSRESYDAIGGHERVKAELNEDMHLARLTKQAGRRLHVIQNDDLYRTRMYSNFQEAWRGWSRIFLGCFGTFRRLIISTLLLCLASILPWVSVIVGALGWATSDTMGHSWQIITLCGAAAVIAQQICLVRFYSLCQAEPKLAPTYIVGAVIALTMLLSAMMKLGGRTSLTWRGTTYRGKRLDSSTAPAKQKDQVV